ncbi:MAG: DNA ligase D [Armatimonadota bacterium]|jgi:bifunctional non-homologous end joining protein LigD
MSLDDYQSKRDFDSTSEPKGDEVKPGEGHHFVVNEHHATHLHFDLRLEIGGVLKSWAVPKGPSMNPKEKRLAVMVEDHPLDYLDFRGKIEDGNYGAGEVEIWDSGTYQLIEYDLDKGKVLFQLAGVKLKGEFHLVRLKSSNDEWLLIKGHDQYAQSDWKLQQVLPGGGRKEREEIVESAGHKGGSAAAGDQLAADKMPDKIAPMLATLIDAPFTDARWLFEVKWDGYRAIAFISPKAFKLQSRNNLDMLDRFPQAEVMPGFIDAETAILDGEMVMLDENGKPNFQALQNVARYYPGGDQAAHRKFQLVYYVFDLLYLNGRDLRSLPLIERKEMLSSIIRPNDFVKYSDHIEARGEDLFAQASAAGLEGVVGKRMDSPYVGRRSSYWVKIKAILRQEVVIGGYTQPLGSRAYFGSLVVGVYEKGKLRPAGQVGGGFEDTLQDIFAQLKPLVIDDSPFDPIPSTNTPAIWVQPTLVCEVKFAQWTDDGIMRQPVFVGMRSDKDAREVVRESARHTGKLTHQRLSKVAGVTKAPMAAEEFFRQGKLSGDAIVAVDSAEVALSNLDKIYWPAEGYTKGDLLNYYYTVRDTILPHLKDRPLILRRFPDGIDEESFYQHNLEGAPEYLRTVPIQEGDSIVNYAVADTTASLLYLANLGCIATNPFMSRVDSLQTPDYIAIDLDPEEVSFDLVCEVAMAVKSVLDEIGIEGFAKTSGSRGMHIFIPIEGIYDFAHTQSFGEILAGVVAARVPEIATTQRSIKERIGKQVYVDHLQNAAHKTLAGVYCVRECPGATVSTPLRWEEVAGKPDKREFTILTVPQRIEKYGDIFAGVLNKRQRLADALDRLQKLH